MAIAEMKRVSVLLMRRDQKRFLHKAQQMGCLQFTPVEQTEGISLLTESKQSDRIDEELSRVRFAISKLSRYDQDKPSMIKPLPAVDQDAILEDDVSAALQIVSKVEELERKSGDLRGQETRLKLQTEQLSPWMSLDIPTNRINDTKQTRVFSGQAKTRELTQLRADWQGKPITIIPLSTQRDTTFFVAYAHVSQADAFLAALREIGFQPSAPQVGEGTPKQQSEHAQLSMEQIKLDQAEIERNLTELGTQMPTLRLAFESLTARKARIDAQSMMAHTHHTSYLTGWVPEAAVPAFTAVLEQEFPEALFTISSPEEGEEPPVLLRNNAMAAPYEAVVTGFSPPAYHSIDPTAIMAPFFACFFGMMVSDAGYGLMMALLIPILIKVLKPTEGARRIFWIICGGGVLTVLWGALYNTWFGFSPFPSVFDPVNDALPVMAVCVGLGALHLFTGLLIGAYRNIRDGDPLSAVYDQFSWMILVIGLGLLALPQTAAIGQWMAIAGAGIILLTAGRAKTKNPFKRLISGFGALYGVTSWISDLLSYMRLFGMGLATGVIGMVINQLVGMIMGGGILGYVIGAVIFVGAHLFNAAINILGAYVHACRLQYIEFFGKFYEEGGLPFRPLGIRPRYVRVRDAS